MLVCLRNIDREHKAPNGAYFGSGKPVMWSHSSSTSPLDHSYPMENADLSSITTRRHLRGEGHTSILRAGKFRGKSAIMAFLQATSPQRIPHPHGTFKSRMNYVKCSSACSQATWRPSKFSSLSHDPKDPRSSRGHKIHLGCWEKCGVSMTRVLHWLSLDVKR